MSDITGAARREKQWAAASSVAAASGLTAIKIIVGLITGSLGLLAEAAHSGLDLVAAVITAIAVRKSDKPADREHTYGHGKIENLSALVETALLLITCAWIVYIALQRIISGNIEIEVNAWSFAVIVVSILVDVSRSRMLYRVARKFQSQALEADALHFSTDIWSSVVVLFGLFCVKLNEWLQAYEFLHYADAVAAITVALIVIHVSVKLGLRSVNALLDSAPPGAEQKIMAVVQAIPEICDCHNLRIRSVGHQTFIDLHVRIDGNISLQEAHDLTKVIEKAVYKVMPRSDITIHTEPTE